MAHLAASDLTGYANDHFVALARTRLNANTRYWLVYDIETPTDSGTRDEIYNLILITDPRRWDVSPYGLSLPEGRLTKTITGANT